MVSHSDPAALGLRVLDLSCKPYFDHVCDATKDRISDYSFCGVYVWHTALKLYWTSIHRHACVFANGTGDLTMLVPPLAEPGANLTDLKSCLAECNALMDEYNTSICDVSHTRIEYVSSEILQRIDIAWQGQPAMKVTEMSGDYVYRTADMVELPGRKLSSKRRARSRFIRQYPDWTTADLTDDHVPACIELLRLWQLRADLSHVGQVTVDDSTQHTNILREKEVNACQIALSQHRQLALTGMVLYVGDVLVGFTLGELLSPHQACVVIEKTHPEYSGSAQLIFSEFCRQYWSDTQEINAGDDWGIPTLQFTKESYRPCRRLNKYCLTPVHQAVTGPVPY